MKPALLAILLLALWAPPVHANDFSADDGGGAAMPDGVIQVTGYLPTGNRTASGLWPYPGSAACPRSFEYGSRLQLSGKVDLIVTCLDRTPGNPWLVDVFVRYLREATALTGSYSYTLLPEVP